jgi:PhzF family phenazine biosynthesis protein
MKLPIHQVDAFTDRVFGGNPAAVVPLDEWIDDGTLQAIALENNLSETAFTVPRGDRFELRWFTPTVEVDLCGHATLAAAHVLMGQGAGGGGAIEFETRSGTLTVRRDGDRLALDLPARPGLPVAASPEVARALGATPEALFESRDLLAVFACRRDVEVLAPDFDAVGALATYAVIATAPGDDCDFVSRFFAPGAGVPEDPVTGSAHCTLVPYWSQRLGRTTLRARQVSRRGGELFCEHRGDRVIVAGRAVSYLRGEIEV